VRSALVLFAAFGAALVLYGLWPERREGAPGEGIRISEALGAADAAGFERAEGARHFSFPEDHGPHPDYRTEWWYFTGNLASEEGRAFGYELTFFRNALAPEGERKERRASAWATRQVYMAHLALTDIGGGRFFAVERFDREALELAGARSAPFRVWLDGWEIEGADGGFFPLRLKAGTGEMELALSLEQGKPLVLEGDGGLSPKGPEPGNASWYYSFTRLPTTGSLRVGDQTFAVKGTSWIDREWSTSALGPDLVGWDWFALQLSNGYDLMLYRLRTKGGGVDRFSSATLVSPDGSSEHLDASAFLLRSVATWKSPRDGTTWPVGWKGSIPSRDISLEVEAALPDQELQVSVRYWEGAVRVKGTFEGAPVDGRGYLELTGY
jgi:predicted secreted hydrolase